MLANVTFQRTTTTLLGGANVFDGTHTTLKIFVPDGLATGYRLLTNLNTWRHRIHSIGCQLPNQTNINIVCACL
jgi:hypothetical protein